MLYQSAPLSNSITLLNAFLLIVVQWQALPHPSLIIWFSIIFLITLARFGLSYAYKKSGNGYLHSDVWVNRFLIGTVMMALAWGSTSFFLFPQQAIEHQVFLAFVIAGMCAGAVTTLSFLKSAIVLYLSIQLIPLAYQFYSSQSNMAWAMGAMVTLFYFVTLTSAMRIHRDTKANIKMRIESDKREETLRKSEARYRLIFESAPLGIIHYDRDSVVHECNNAFDDMLSASNKTFVGTNMLDTFKNDEVRKAIKTSLRGEIGIFTGPMSALSGDGERPIRIYFQGIAVSAHCTEGGVAIIEDTSEEHRINRLKGEFISTVSHELKTPLTSIIGSLSLLKSDTINQQEALKTNLIDTASRNAERLHLLINDILDLDKIAQGRMAYSFKPIEVMALIDQALQQNQYLCEKYNVHIKLLNRIDTAYIKADIDRLLQVLGNLLSNAAKFSPEHSNVEINVNQQDDNTITLSIVDYGLGIPDAFHDKIFQRFSQYDGSDIKRVGGTGLGLNISKAIVEAHQGNITFTTEVNEGSTFEIHLPLFQSASLHSQTESI